MRDVAIRSWDGLSRATAGRRLEMPRHLRHHPAGSIAALARALQRDYKRVHEDVEALVAAGLMVRDETWLRIGHDEIRTSIVV